MEKSKLQKKEYDYLKNHKRVILRWATGVGKSKMTIDLVNNAIHILHTRKEDVSVLLVVAERAHIKNWEDEFTKWHLDKNGITIKTICYASLKKEQDKEYDILIFDEAHHCFTEKRMAVLETLKSEYVYMLSATLPFQKVMDLTSIFGKFTVSTVSLKKAIGEDILPDPKVYLIRMKLDNTVSNQEIVIGKTSNPPIVDWTDRHKYIYKKIPCIIKCTARQKYDYYTEKMEYWKDRYQRSHNQFQHNQWVSTGSLRKRFLGELKTSAVRRLVDTSLKHKRFICFCTSVSQAEELDNANTISSRKQSKTNQALINKFNEKVISRLYAVGMANEGLNLTDIQAGIIVQLDGKERLFVQKFGRSLRAEDPVAYIFYYENTQDEKYLKVALENVDEKYIKRINHYESSI